MEFVKLHLSISGKVTKRNSAVLARRGGLIRNKWRNHKNCASQQRMTTATPKRFLRRCSYSLTNVSSSNNGSSGQHPCHDIAENLPMEDQLTTTDEKNVAPDDIEYDVPFEVHDEDGSANVRTQTLEEQMKFFKEELNDKMTN